MNKTTEKTVDATPLDIDAVRRDFPVLHQDVRGKPLAYLDNAATTQKPEAVIRRVHDFYMHDNANVHRGVHTLSQRATDAFDYARVRVKEFLGAADVREIVFTRGATEAINLVAHAWGRKFLREGDEIIVTELEHHSNLVPWFLLCKQLGVRLRVLPINDRGEVMVEKLPELLGPRTRLVATTHVSNALGTVVPVKQIIDLAHAEGAKVIVDGAQAVAHMPVNVQELGADFYVFSGHKIFAPTGVGVLYARADLLEEMDPFLGGGDMILKVTFDEVIFNRIPYKFEAGTPPIAQAIGLSASLDYLDHLGWDRLEAYERELLEYGTQKLESLEGVRLIGTAASKIAVLAFVIDNVHPHDAGTILDQAGVAVRAGHHCAQPVMEHFQVPATIRASLAFYNTRDELDRLAEAVRQAHEFFA